jgi:ABC-type multidrug transport system fused ATPase/permease subunit
MSKNLTSAETAPFWIGLAVTCIAAITTSVVLSLLEKTSFGGVSLDDATQKRLIQRLTRDCDAIQSAASIVAVLASELLIVHLSPAEGAIAFCFGGVVALASLLILGRVSAATYSHYTKGLFTPLAVSLLVLNILGLVLVVAFGSPG